MWYHESVTLSVGATRTRSPSSAASWAARVASPGRSRSRCRGACAGRAARSCRSGAARRRRRPRSEPRPPATSSARSGAPPRSPSLTPLTRVSKKCCKPKGFDGRQAARRGSPGFRRALPRGARPARAGRRDDRPAELAARFDEPLPRARLPLDAILGDLEARSSGRPRRRHRRALLRVRHRRLAAGRGDRGGLDGRGRPEPRHVAARPGRVELEQVTIRWLADLLDFPGRSRATSARAPRWRTPIGLAVARHCVRPQARRRRRSSRACARCPSSASTPPRSCTSPTTRHCARSDSVRAACGRSRSTSAMRCASTCSPRRSSATAPTGSSRRS